MTRRRKSPGTGKIAKKTAATPKVAEEKPASKNHAKDGATKSLWLAVAIGVLLVIGGGLAFQYLWSGQPPSRAEADPISGLSFVGSDTCAGCHAGEATLWHASQHAHAMAHASDKTVLGDFNDASFDAYGVTSRFFKKDGKFFVDTDGADGKIATFEVKYTFGVDPLQQYLVEFPDGRIQALPIAWDTRPKSEGGQRWFHLYPNEHIGHDDVLHWTKLNQNWNFMCAECHSTGVHKNYDAKTDRFDTRWSEISVGCEACHGQGSAHVAWARAGTSWLSFWHDAPDKGLLVNFDERAGVSWTRDAKTGQPVRSQVPPELRKEVETCGLCHARRGQISEDWIPGRSLSDTHVVALLTQGVYQADGQMQDEVYNYGPFKQSRMFAAGVTCSDCHDPHSAKLKLEGDKVCLQCHAGSYAEAAHTHHEGVTPAVGCVSCHMPARTYMVIDTRHDHSFRVPRPDLSASLGTSNACTDCHKDKSAAWAAAAIEGWFGPERKGLQTYGQAFHAAWHDAPDAERLLEAVTADAKAPAFARASALSALAAYVSPENVGVARSGLADSDPMVRLGALDMLQSVPPDQLFPLLSPLLDDQVRAVRIRAASLLAGAPTDGLSEDERKRLDAATKEFVATQELNADRPESRAMLGGFYARRGELKEAEAEYQAAIRLSPAYATASANLADLYRQMGRDTDAETALRAALQASPQDAGLHHALGLTMVRLKRQDEALAELARAAEIEPDRSRYAYVYAIGLDSAGRRADAEQVLKDNLAKHPNDRDTLSALVGFARDERDAQAALLYGEQLLKLEPDDPQLKAMVGALHRQLGTAPAQ